MSADQPRHSFDVVIAGGGVAALEATLALRDLARDLVEVTLVSPTDRFTFAPASVGVPFGKSVVRQFDLFRIANDLGARLVVGAVAAVEPDRKRVILADGRPLAYRALLIASGGAAREAIPGALTFRGPADVDSVRTCWARSGTGASTGCCSRCRPAWAGHCRCTNSACSRAAIWSSTTTFTTTPTATGDVLRPQIGWSRRKRPRSKRWRRASATVVALLDELGVMFHPGQTPVRFHDGRLVTLPGGSLMADRVLAMPRLKGTQITGITVDSEGFIRTDRSGRVDNLIDVYAAGDATAFPIEREASPHSRRWPPHRP